MKALVKTLFSLFFFFLGSQLVAQTDSLQAENYTDSLGKKQGKWVEFYENGKCKSIAFYKDGKLDSTYKSFYETGELCAQISFRSDLHHGTRIDYYKTGEMHKLGFYSMGEPIWTSIYDQDGYLLMEEIFHNGKCISIIHYEKGRYVTRGTPKN